MPRALIIGHRGQDGSILWDQLAARGFSLVGISRHETRTHGEQWEGIVDITDLSCVRHLMERFHPDQVYYLAAHHHSSQESAVDEASAWHASWAINLHAFSHFLLAAKDSCPRARFFYASSSRVFGEASISPQDENVPLEPSCIYGITKASGMLLGDYYRRNHGLFASCGVLFNHESPLRGAQFVSQRVANGLVALKYGAATTLEIGSLDARVDWGFAPDYTRAMQLILETETAENFVVATGETHSVRDMITIAADYLDLAWEGHVVETNRILRRRSQDLCGDASRLRQVTGWKPSIGFQEMTRILVDAAVERHHERLDLTPN
jgi:GDPmannose 4,6-dehydratase